MSHPSIFAKNKPLRMSSPSLIWFQLIDSETGLAYKNTRSVKTKLKASADVDDFLNAVKTKYPNKLATVDAGELLVFKNKAAFDKRNADVGKEFPLEEDADVARLGKSKNEDLIVVVPPSLTLSSNKKRKGKLFFIIL